MRVTSVSLYSNNVEAVTFSLRDSDPTAQYMVREMVGLDNEELIPKFYGFGLTTGSKFYDFRMKPREIVIRLVLNPRFKLDQSYSDVRDALFRTISSARTGLIALHFNSGGTTVSRIFGFITKFEVAYFSPLPEVQITIRCDDAMFRAINPVTYKPAELKTTNPIIVPDSLSTAPHGFQFDLQFKAASPALTIQDAAANQDWSFKVIPSGGFLNGDVLHFSSDYTNKYLYLTRAAVNTYLIDKIQPNSVWPIIFPGGSTFYFLEIANFNWLKLEYYAAYWGV